MFIEGRGAARLRDMLPHLPFLSVRRSGVYFSPASFIKSPPLWMALASAHRGTHLQAPSFA